MENIKVTGTFEKQAPGNRTKIRYVNYFPANIVIQQNKLSKTYLDTRSHNFPVEGIWNPEIR